MRQRIKMAVRSSEKIEPISAVCVLLVSRANLLPPWQTASKLMCIPSHFCASVVFELRVNIAFVS